jgi:ubiquinone/menaquinone biosynthesis C-methylase UbiE
MNYIENNKKAWNEVYEKHKKHWDENPVTLRIKKNKQYLNNDMTAALNNNSLSGKNIAQFCCNNGRELLSVVKMFNCRGTGFDISENFIQYADSVAEELNLDCDFVCTDILEIPDIYSNKYDLVFSTIGTICWFRDLELFFRSVRKVLKQNGIFVLNETHAFMNCFAMDYEDEFDKDNPEKIVYSYFKNDEWISNEGLDYYGNTKYSSETFTSFSHTFSDIINSMVNNNLRIEKVLEFDYSLHSFSRIEKNKLPVSMIITGKRD